MIPIHVSQHYLQQQIIPLFTYTITKWSKPYLKSAFYLGLEVSHIEVCGELLITGQYLILHLGPDVFIILF